MSGVFKVETMRCPTLGELPAPPPGKSGWPWTVAAPQLAGEMPGGRRWPRITVVVASLNQGQYIEEMIRSALLQGYPDLELMVVDGGSTDGTLEILARYAEWFSYYVSEPDRGQSHAFNKGLARLTGSLFSVFDTDDIFLPGCFALVGETHARNPASMIAGDVIRTWEGSARSEVYRPAETGLREYAEWWNIDHHGQPGLFYPACHFAKVGFFDENLHYLMDYEFTCRYLAVTDFHLLRCPVAVIRHHAQCKSSLRSDYFVLEVVGIAQKYQRLFPEIDSAANRFAAGYLFRSGCLRLLRGQGDAWLLLKKGLRAHPFWAIYFVFPGWLLRKWSRLFSA